MSRSVRNENKTQIYCPFIETTSLAQTKKNDKKTMKRNDLLIVAKLQIHCYAA
jgi:hypothetical protein